MFHGLIRARVLVSTSADHRTATPLRAFHQCLHYRRESGEFIHKLLRFHVSAAMLTAPV